MQQLQLPIFPAGVTEINSRIAVQKEAGRVCYIHGHLPVFQHEEQDVRSFRMFTSQMIESGAVKPKQIFQTEADLTPDLAANTLTVRLHHLTQATHDQAIEHLLANLNATQTVFPGTSLTLIFKLGSS